MEDENVKCNKCDFKVNISNIHQLSYHILHQHQLKLYSCPICPGHGKSFYASNLKLIENHAHEIHSNDLNAIKKSISLQNDIFEVHSGNITPEDEPGSLVEKLKSFFSSTNSKECIPAQKNGGLDSNEKVVEQECNNDEHHIKGKEYENDEYEYINNLEEIDLVYSSKNIESDQLDELENEINIGQKEYEYINELETDDLISPQNSDDCGSIAQVPQEFITDLQSTNQPKWSCKTCKLISSAEYFPVTMYDPLNFTLWLCISCQEYAHFAEGQSNMNHKKGEIEELTRTPDITPSKGYYEQHIASLDYEINPENIAMNSCHASLSSIKRTDIYWKNEDVLAFDGPRLRLAKIKSILKDNKTNQTKYEMHYEGWLEETHKCVTEGHLVKLNEETFSIKIKLDALSAPCSNINKILGDNRSNNVTKNFKEDEIITIYYNGLLYSAKILEKRNTEKRERQFLVHYHGWKKQWDEWVSAEKIFECTEEVLHIQKMLFEFSKYIKPEKRPLYTLSSCKKKDERKIETCANAQSTKKSSLKTNAIRCICKFLHNDGGMICCDKCDAWQHIACMGVDHENIPKEYFCELCHPRKVKFKKAQMIQRRRKVELEITSKKIKTESVIRRSNRRCVGS